MKILDLFSGAGGAAMGYHRAGFEVVGIDSQPQPRYPFTFIQENVFDASTSWMRTFDAIHASPPCQRFSALRHLSSHDHPDLIAQTRDLLNEVGVPYVIENVVGAPLINPIRLCGSSFNLSAMCRDGVRRELRRHRLFETSGHWMPAYGQRHGGPCSHNGQPIGVYGHGGTGHGGRPLPGSYRGYQAIRVEAIEAMRIDWMLMRELAQAIPPVYTHYIGSFLSMEIAQRYLDVR